MRVLICGSDEVWSLEKSYAKYLTQAGTEVRMCPVQSIFYRYYRASIIHKILYKSGLSGIQNTIDKIVKNTIEEWRPDIIWVFKGMEITPALLQWAKEAGIKLVNYNPDNPFIFSGRGSGNKKVTESVGLYDLHFTYDRDIQRQLEEQY